MSRRQINLRFVPYLLTGALLLAAATQAEDTPTVRAYYDEGLRYDLHNGIASARLQLRSQLRYTYTDSDDLPEGDEILGDESDVDLIRARFKLGGHVWRKWLTYYWENDLTKGQLLTVFGDARPSETLGLRGGQYKVFFSRERVESSGKQTFTERSVVNKAFTIDRQIGGQFVGRIFRDTPFDSNYAVGAFVGAGIDTSASRVDRPMLVARWQWNILGRYLDYSSTDINKRDEAAAALSIGFVNYRSAFTAFSSAGGGALDGLEIGSADQYDTNQVMVESAYQHRGFAFNSEVHWKGIHDRRQQRTINYLGYYLQAGSFPATWCDWVPNPLEIAARHANVIADDPGRSAIEYALGANWYFRKHRNKIQADVTWARAEQADTTDNGWRARLQWDVSF